ncbi:glutamate-cysteine ligase family protein [Haladaptatus halobius]|uniref:glutamate-cysteine ligase family protein n=1 Tax=Haladaptatus halobius TaxID=2884875 RepID=UPI001D0B5005|nr:glutamate-cysteine ligase family protein [Haladaptatus halobius]
MQKSIEVEYWVIDRNGMLTTPGALAEESEYAEEEFVKPLFELKTPPCETYADLESTFIQQLDAVLSKADDLDKILVPLGTPINCESIEQWPSDRGEIQREVLGTNHDYAKYCAGTHIHFEKRNVTDQLNTLIALDPALALTSSSSYFQGERIANDARAYIYRKKGYENFPHHGKLWDYVDTVAEWERRLDQCFEEFKTAAIEAGVDEESMHANFAPDNVVWTPIRLRDEMPTVEWRSPDTALPSQILRLVKEVDAVMEQIHHTNVNIGDQTGAVRSDEVTLPEFETVSHHVEKAIHSGLESPSTATYLERMGFNVHEYDPITPRIDEREFISFDEARDLRCQYGELLRQDVSNLLQD